jgi:ribosomal protein S14
MRSLDLNQLALNGFNLAVDFLQLVHKGCQCYAGGRRQLHSIVVQHLHQTIHPLLALPNNNSELSKMSSDGTRRHGSLTNQQASCSMKHQEALVLDALDWNESHVRASNRFADCGRVSGVVLGSPPHVGLYICRRHQSHIVSKPLDLARPVVRGGAGLYSDQAG